MKTLDGSTSLRELLDRLDRVTPDSVRRWGVMTPHQMICHLNDSFKVAMGEKAATNKSSWMMRTIGKRFALYAPMQWPQNLETMPEVDQKVGGTRPIDFWRDRDSLSRTMSRFVAAEPDFTWSRHPLFGRMSPRDWKRWGYLHMDHHLRQFSA
jgi:hypothetical protein